MLLLIGLVQPLYRLPFLKLHWTEERSAAGRDGAAEALLPGLGAPRPQIGAPDVGAACLLISGFRNVIGAGSVWGPTMKLLVISRARVRFWPLGF